MVVSNLRGCHHEAKNPRLARMDTMVTLADGDSKVIPCHRGRRRRHLEGSVDVR